MNATMLDHSKDPVNVLSLLTLSLAILHVIQHCRRWPGTRFDVPMDEGNRRTVHGYQESQQSCVERVFPAHSHPNGWAFLSSDLS